MANLYASLTRAKLELGITAATDDALLMMLLAAASRKVEFTCGRTFYAETAIRYFRPERADELLVGDLLALTELATDEDSDLDYDYVWTSGDYLLEPANGYPKWKIAVHPDGDYAFPKGLARAARVTGSWGYGDGLRAAPWDSAGITGTVETAGGTTLTLSAAGLEAGQTILVESEQMYVSAVSDGETHTATVERGVNGTTAAAHAAAAVAVAAYPEAARAATIWLAGVSLAARGRTLGVESETIRGYSYKIASPELGRGMLREMLEGLIDFRL
jgi:hypothetical protein